ncbi:hypothetical protein FQN51_000312 [Onygenales sp. PD_10]|nr:hypothetical protein FQN51_000312 [Onygenales sp. PD_10]
MKLSLLAALLSADALVSAVPYIQPPQTTLSASDDDVFGDSLDSIIAASPLLSFHRTICEVESISNNESTVGETLVKYLTDHSFTVEKQPVPLDFDNGEKGNASRFNIFAYPSSGSPRPQIILTSHIDTVPPHIPYNLQPPASTSAPFDRRDIRIKGRGTVDAKASVAAQITAVLNHLSTNPHASLGLLFVVSEERGGAGMVHFSNSPLNTAPPFFHTLIFGEPTDLTLVNGHKGNLPVIVHAKGVAAHSGYPWLGHSAISELIPVLAKIDELNTLPAEQGGFPTSDKFGRTTLNIGLLRGGAAGNVVPASASCNVAMRLTGPIDEAKRIITTAIESVTGGSENITVGFPIKGYPPVDLEVDVDGFEVSTVNYGTDIPKLEIHDEDAVVKVKKYLYGPGSILVAHGEDEGLTVGELERAVDGYERLIEAAVKRG